MSGIFRDHLPLAEAERPADRRDAGRAALDDARLLRSRATCERALGWAPAKGRRERGFDPFTVEIVREAARPADEMGVVSRALSISPSSTGLDFRLRHHQRRSTGGRPDERPTLHRHLRPDSEHPAQARPGRHARGTSSPPTSVQGGTHTCDVCLVQAESSSRARVIAFAVSVTGYGSRFAAPAREHLPRGDGDLPGGAPAAGGADRRAGHAQPDHDRPDRGPTSACRAPASATWTRARGDGDRERAACAGLRSLRRRARARRASRGAFDHGEQSRAPSRAAQIPPMGSTANGVIDSDSVTNAEIPIGRRRHGRNDFLHADFTARRAATRAGQLLDRGLAVGLQDGRACDHEQYAN